MRLPRPKRGRPNGAAPDLDVAAPDGARSRARRGGKDTKGRKGRATKRGWLPELARDRRVEAFGVAIIAFGCVVTGLVWMGIREASNVAYQLPIVASGGLVAMGCFTVGGMLLVGGIVMTRFARLENARRAHRVAPLAGGEVVLSEESVERREAVRARRRVSAGRSSES